MLHNIDLVLVPCTVKNFHWSLLAFQRGVAKTFYIIDPLKRASDAMLAEATKLVAALGEVYSIDGGLPLTVQRYPQNTFFQGDDNLNCGPWVCWFMDCLMGGQPLSGEVDIVDFRWTMRRTIEEAIGVATNVQELTKVSKNEQGPDQGKIKRGSRSNGDKLKERTFDGPEEDFIQKAKRISGDKRKERK